MFANPEKNIEQLGLLPGMRVADLGSGSGFYSIAAAKLVGGNGKVYSVDVQKDLLAKVKNEASKMHLLNIEAVWGDIERIKGTRLSDGIVDAVIASNVIFQIKDKSIFAEEVKRILKRNGKLLVIDWSESFGLGMEGASIFNSMAAKKLFEPLGFFVEREFNAGDHHYGIIFKKI